MIRLIATDLDGTLLRSDRTVSARTRAALDAARRAGLHVVPVTARQPRSLREGIADAAGFAEWALCGNGAHGLHLTTGETLFEAHVNVAAQSRLARALLERRPEVRFASVRQGGEVFVAQYGYAALAAFTDHHRHPHEMGAHPLDAVLAEPSLKFIARSPRLAPPDLLGEIHALGLDGFTVTHSGAPFVEVLAAGVHKAWGVARLCERLGVARTEVLAFGDAPNDAQMLAWAGRGVAMANAEREALDAADEVTLGNDEDGVAVTVEALLRAQA
ncbi:HAD family hydrolase [Deinococcus aquiradiocola]|uniref:Hydrolase n=1 Tax=Deinococcus aquiradiocola TaxID=393059 RepID=A0A917PFY7_9DEIO|nr:HAD family hydrolase [Deinococcus aquiradiocola]GGJ75689.1 hydrolase [Deinococcus aquiradiocola]